jgi:hypothetical protein
MIEEIYWIYLEFLITVWPMTNGRLSRFGNRIRALSRGRLCVMP